MDITEQHQLEEELRRSSRLESIGRLAGGVAHDFNNLLTAMLGSVELVEELCPDAAKQDLSTIRHSVLRARDLTRQLLAFARKQPVAWTTVDVAKLVHNVELMLRRLVGPSIRIVIESSEPVLVRADPSLLEQVLVNLVVNARDAMPNGGRLEIHIRRETTPLSKNGQGPELAVLEVLDSGVGMNDETRRKVFDPFFTTKLHGTGLGLASSYGIVQQHQGDITVESQPGQGTRFRVTFPRLATPTATTEVDEKKASVRPFAGVVIVVDDEDIVRQTTVRMVKSLGYDALAAANGTEAQQCAAQYRGGLQILLCDIAMPGEDGLEVAERLRAQCPGLRVLFMSGYTSDTLEERLAGALFLQKPFSRAEIAEKFNELKAV